MNAYCKLILTGLLAVFAGCASETSASVAEATSATCAAPPAGNPAAKLRADIVPILNRGCTFSSCHGAGTSNHGVTLSGDPSAVRARLVGVQAETASMAYVEAGDPEESFLLHKVEGSFCGIEERCRNGKCGERMPKQSVPLTTAEKSAFRGWIANGALDD